MSLKYREMTNFGDGVSFSENALILYNNVMIDDISTDNEIDNIICNKSENDFNLFVGQNLGFSSMTFQMCH